MDANHYALPALSMVMLGVRDLQKSLAFYQNLGVKVRQQVPGFAFLDTGTVSLILSEAAAKASQNVAGATEVIFSVDDVTGHHAALLERGVEFSHSPHNVSGPMWAANFRDPDGHLLTLFGPEKKS
ncbi:MAG TPA: VOC family protein [Terriglobales bacterium]|nr:VOC family protein [Terriglobales bacterium]